MSTGDVIERRIAEVEQEIRDHGFELRYVEWCEDAQTPAPFPGMILGKTNHRDRVVAIATAPRPMQSRIVRLRVLKHELRHVLDPTWVCGSRTRIGWPELDRTVYPPRVLTPSLMTEAEYAMQDYLTECRCVRDCRSCSLSGVWHTHPEAEDPALFGECPLHRDAPGDV